MSEVMKCSPVHTPITSHPDDQSRKENVVQFGKVAPSFPSVSAKIVRHIETVSRLIRLCGIGCHSSSIACASFAGSYPSPQSSASHRCSIRNIFGDVHAIVRRRRAGVTAV